MSTPTIRFDVTDMTSTRGRCHIGERATFEAAEKLARWHAARRGIRVEVDKITETKTHRYNETMATVSRDALDRLWTDLTWHGAAFI